MLTARFVLYFGTNIREKSSVLMVSAKTSSVFGDTLNVEKWLTITDIHKECCTW